MTAPRAWRPAPPGRRGKSDALSSRASLLVELGRRERAAEDLSRALALGAADWPQRPGAEARLKALQGERP
jgi:hypothetical protein